MSKQTAGHTPSGSLMYLDGLEMAPRRTTFEEIENQYRKDFKGRNLPANVTYEQMSHAYRLGHEGACDPKYSKHDWHRVEEFLKKEWESRNPGTWHDVKDAVRYAWESNRSSHIPS